MKSNKLILGIIILVVFAIFSGSVLAGSKMYINDVVVHIDGEKETGADESGGTIRGEVRPESTIKIEVEVANNFTSSEGLDLNDVQITITAESIDDGDDIEVESDEFDIDQGDKESDTLEFDIPLVVDDKSYDITILVEGEDDNNTKRTATLSLDLIVEKESHLLKITKKTLDSDTSTCTSFNELNLAIANIGENDEDDTLITVKNSALGLDYSKVIDFSSDPDDDNIDWSAAIPITVASTVATGTYVLNIDVSYDGGDEKLSESVNLIVGQCLAQTSTATAPTPATTTTTTASSTTTTVSTPATTTTTTPTTAASTTTSPQTTTTTPTATPAIAYSSAVSDETSNDSVDYLVVIGIVVLMIIIAVVAVFVIVKIAKRKKN